VAAYRGALPGAGRDRAVGAPMTDRDNLRVFGKSAWRGRQAKACTTNRSDL